jgi:sec-independent protein translocase protein TatA
MPGWVSPPELLLLALVALLVFGPKRLPEMGRSLGRGMRELRDAIANDHDGDEPSPLPERAVAAAAPREYDTI